MIRISFLLIISVLSVQAQSFTGSSIIVSIPKNQHEYELMFHSKPTPEQWKSVSETVARFKNNSNVHFVSSSEDFKRITAIKPEPYGYYTIIGHNEAGLFYFPDGNSMKLADMEKQLAFHIINGIFLSCNASDYIKSPAINHNITGVIQNYAACFLRALVMSDPLALL